ncbi:glycosyltransferase [Arthrobacter citreus]|uniref:Glycosyltransferase n=1 Tax=Arthrobacter citreus TaxID=1670 RepID=A0ABZ2ZWX8_9MICC
MTSVYRARALSRPDVHFDFIFLNDRGGLGAYESIPNCSVRIVARERLFNYVNYLLKNFTYSEISITSIPDLPAAIKWDGQIEVCYEFHSPIPSIIDAEIRKLDFGSIDVVRTPSDWASELVRQRLPRRQHVQVITEHNIVDELTFRPAGEIAPTAKRENHIPVLWIGRFENSQKNYVDFLRVLSLLPEAYYGLMVVSLETDPTRMAQVLGAAAYYGVEDRLDVYLNVAQKDMGSIHRMVASQGGVFCSTSLSETFGYGVAEAGKCDVPVVAYDVGPLKEHTIQHVRYVPVGSLTGMAEGILHLSHTVSV